MGVLCCYFRPKMFSPGDHVRYHSRTLAAHVLATVGINAKVASHVFSLLASVEGTTVCLEIPLQSPPPPPGRPSLGDRPPRPPGRPSRANPGVCKGGGGYKSSAPRKHAPFVCSLVCGNPPPPLSWLRPCPSYSRRRDRIDLGPHLIQYQM